jgi:hypothetical protein
MTALFYKKGETVPGLGAVTLPRGANTIVFKQVPAEVEAIAKNTTSPRTLPRDC